MWREIRTIFDLQFDSHIPPKSVNPFTLVHIATVKGSHFANQGEYFMLMMKTLLTSECVNQWGAGQRSGFDWPLTLAVSISQFVS